MPWTNQPNAKGQYNFTAFKNQFFLLIKVTVIVEISQINSNFSQPIETDSGEQTLDGGKTYPGIESLPEIVVRPNAFMHIVDRTAAGKMKVY